jgi:superfamily II DNA or RNA helicase
MYIKLIIYNIMSNKPVIAYICHKGAYIFVKDLSTKELNYIHTTFTIKNKTIMGFWDITKYYSYYKVNNEPCILVPRFGLRIICKKIKLIARNQIQAGLPARFKITAKFRGNQKIVFDELISTYFHSKQVKKGLAGAIIKLQAGQGKTFLGLQIIAYLKMKTFIVVHNELILKQWHKTIIENMPNVKVGLYYGKIKTENSDITIGIINSALNYEKWHEIGLCIFDEAHLYSSKGRAEIYNMCQSTYMLGLSATPEDKKEKLDNSYKLIQWQIGPILDAVTISGYTEEDIPFQGQVRVVKYRGHPDYTHTLINEALEIVSNSKMINQLTQDPYRIKLVTKLAREIILQPNTNLFIFANRRSYLQDIHARLIEETNDDNILFLTDDNEHDVVMTIMGQSNEDDVARAEINSRIILTTYQYFGVGKSIPRMNAMLLATPFKTGTEQYIGRIFRLGSDYTIVRNIIDIVDWDVTLKSQFYSRRKFYNKKEYPIETEEVTWVQFQ